MVCEYTLRIKNLPSCLNNPEKEDFLKHFGATDVKIITSNVKQKSIAFAKFDTKQMAKAVLHRLHQIKVLDSMLCVEYAETDITQSKSKTLTNETNDVKNKKHYKTFITKINAFNNSVSFNQPPPAHLRYLYPKANRATINNIAHALASVPKFYTQVLHLMNRMNLPPPFSDTPDHPKPQARVVQTAKVAPQSQVQEQSHESSESEIESDPETKQKDIIPMKRVMPQKKRTVKRPKFIKPPNIVANSHPKEVHENVFEKTDLNQRKIELKVSTECLENKSEDKNDNIGSFGIIEPSKKEAEPCEAKEEVTKDNSFISEQELNENRIPLKDLSVLPVFKDYHPGIPSCRLYIKNIAKTVIKSDLEYIYKRYYIEKDNEEANQFDVRLLQEGRMKGQAFITLESIDIAQKALKETNGYILKEKPLVVMYARSAAKK